ncbi:MAG: TetR/AcrR family transcriptional regulator [Novosphingobium sp.]|nr:TetR/AcrR family transcriptional regulator [Novosphingobium sp.]
MKPERKSGEESGSTRDAILDATEAIMVEEGYSAVTSRRVAERAGLKSQLVHYYFRTMDELFVTAYERSEKEFLQRHLQAVSSQNPIRALWDLAIHPKRTRLSQELIALSHHRKSMRSITARVLEQTHAINTAFIGKYLQEAGVDPDEFPPVVVSHIINGLSRGLINEEAVGVSQGHSELRAFAECWISKLEAAHGQAHASGDKAEIDAPASA